MSEHTPGPWFNGHFADPNSSCDCRYVTAEASYPGGICTVAVSNGIERISDGWNGDPPLEEAIANSHLICAAPELLEALERLLEHVEVIYNYKDAIVLGSINCVGSVRSAQEAVSKARGESCED